MFELYLGLIHVTCVSFTSHFFSSQRVQLRIGIIGNVFVPYLFVVNGTNCTHGLTSKQNRAHIYVGTVMEL